ncbi:MAG: hypothetical protein LBQ34_06500 [Alphaproteobacteria bacterium]|jgi:hypothetical protein|nr:hypothetical protein [Alphaproteobacteria bacterium]
MLESITKFFSLSLLELSVYDLVILVLFVVSLILTLVFGLIVVATKVRKLDNDIESQISKQISSDKAIINYLDVIMNQLSNSKVDLKSNGEIRDTVSKQESSSVNNITAPSTAPSTELAVVAQDFQEEVRITENTTVAKETGSKEDVAQVAENIESENTAENEIKQVEKTIRERRYARANRNSLANLENDIKNIPIERKKIIEDVKESINVLTSLEEVAQNIEDKIKQAETQESSDVPAVKPRVNTNRDREALYNEENTPNVNINTTPNNSVAEEGFSEYENIDLDNMPNDYDTNRNQHAEHGHQERHEHNREFQHREHRDFSRERPTLGDRPRHSDFNRDRFQTRSAETHSREPSSRFTPQNRDSNHTNSHMRGDSSAPASLQNRTIPRFGESAGLSRFAPNRPTPTERPSLSTPRPSFSTDRATQGRAAGDFAVDRNTNFSNNVNNRINNRLGDSIGLNSERANFRPLSLNLLNRRNEGNATLNRVNQANPDVATSNNEEGQDMYNNRSGMNRGGSQGGMSGGMSRPQMGGMNRGGMSGGMNRPQMGGGMSSSMGGMNRGGSQGGMSGGMNRPMGGGSMNRGGMSGGSMGGRSMGGMKPANATMGGRPQLSSSAGSRRR